MRHYEIFNLDGTRVSVEGPLPGGATLWMVLLEMVPRRPKAWHLTLSPWPCSISPGVASLTVSSMPNVMQNNGQENSPHLDAPFTDLIGMLLSFWPTQRRAEGSSHGSSARTFKDRTLERDGALTYSNPIMSEGLLAAGFDRW